MYSVVESPCSRGALGNCRGREPAEKRRRAGETKAGGHAANERESFPSLAAFPRCCVLVLLVALKPRPAGVSERSGRLKDNFCRRFKDNY